LAALQESALAGVKMGWFRDGKSFVLFKIAAEIGFAL
jgi:hypothetical protein